MVTHPSASRFVLLVSLFLVVFGNFALWRSLLSILGGFSIEQAPFLISVFLVLWLVFFVLLSLLAVPFVVKPSVIALLLCGSVAAYFMTTYGVYLDRTMVQNIFESDLAEVTELLSWRLVVYVVLLGCVPSVLVAFSRISYRRVSREAPARVAGIALALAAISAIYWTFNQSYTHVGREHPELRDLVNPMSIVSASISQISRTMSSPAGPLLALGEDARQRAIAPAGRKPSVLVLVLGETARAESFALNGYGRDTNPRLGQEDVINFSQVYACGTSTAASVPCMFSHLDQRSYDRASAARSENLLDVVSRAGIRVLWRDNNSGCKGVCARVENEDVRSPPVEGLCVENECYDERLLLGLDQRLATVDRDVLLVLHQKGSHGPRYDLRYPSSFQHFEPVCKSNDVQECSRAELTNAYDNTIRYTDHVLAELIAWLRSREDRFTSAVLYVSDHGESLGESGLYLHGLPTWIAPDQQTHVPMVLWFSAGFAAARGIDVGCLRERRDQEFSHDSLFHSVLGLMDVQTKVYEAELDVVGPCRRPQGSGDYARHARS